MQTNQKEPSKLILEARKRLSMTGVDTVDGFTEQTLRLTVSGEKLTVNGENIKIISFNKANGNLLADGIFHEIKYSKVKLPLVKRLLK